MKNMNKGSTSFKFNKGPKAYKLKRDKVPVIPFLSLSSGGRARRRKGQNGRLGELRVAEDTKRRSRWPSPRARVMTTSGAKLEDEAAERQHAVEDDVYSDFAALSPALFLFSSLPTPAAQGDDPGEFKEPATRMMESPVPHGAATGA